MQRVLVVGLDEPESEELRRRVHAAWVTYPFLPAYRLVDGQLEVESRKRVGQWLSVDAVVFHGVFEEDYEFMTALALWDGPCFTDPVGMLDCRHRMPNLARARRVSAFGGAPRGFVPAGETYPVEDGETRVAKWSNWHCGKNKARFDADREADEPTLVEPFFDGEAVRITLLGDEVFQHELAGDDWLKSIEDERTEPVEPDPEIEDDARRIADHFGLEIAGIDYVVGPEETHLLEVNHVPNIDYFEAIREAYLDEVADWIGGL